jgi:osmotically-inducible protein OsmY
MDSTLVGQITTRLQENADTSMLKIDVTSDQGVVTLNGTARTLEQIGKAIALSLDTGGVTQTISQIKLQTVP